jgi:hypothetical protein
MVSSLSQVLFQAVSGGVSGSGSGIRGGIRRDDFDYTAKTAHSNSGNAKSSPGVETATAGLTRNDYHFHPQLNNTTSMTAIIARSSSFLSFVPPDSQNTAHTN